MVDLTPRGGDGGDPDGCAACGGTLLIKADRTGGRAWLTCAGCEREFRLGPIFQAAVRDATGDPEFILLPIGAEDG